MGRFTLAAMYAVHTFASPARASIAPQSRATALRADPRFTPSLNPLVVNFVNFARLSGDPR